MRRLADERIPMNLALSLHAPDESLRRSIIPWAEHFELSDILDACRHYFEQTGREVTFEYILLGGVNDRPEHARLLAEICRTGGFRVNVNLLRYNEVEGLAFERPGGGVDGAVPVDFAGGRRERPRPPQPRAGHRRRVRPTPPQAVGGPRGGPGATRTRGLAAV